MRILALELDAAVAAVVAAAAAAGCGTYTAYQTAEPLPAGRWQGSLAVTPGVFVDRPSSVTTPSAMFEVAGRRGVGADTDLGVKLYTVGFEATVRHRFFEGEWSWAVLGALGGARTKEQVGFSDAVMGEARIVVAATHRTSPRWAFTIGPGATGSFLEFAGGGSAHGLMLGAFANAEYTIGARRIWHVTPELSLHGTLAGDVPVDGAAVMGGVAFARDF